ncbi:hypothetical protein C0992_010873 [Termitomyces sp. T32_za158]|nr:hypothetical protein C0992_010873 [Termitomyces sp. T32_za158]
MGALFSIVGLSCMGAFFSIASYGLPDKTPLIHFAPKPASLSVKKTNSDETEQISFRTLVENRSYIGLTDGGTLGLDFAPIDDSKLKDDVPIVVVKHGLTGGKVLMTLLYID